MRQLGEGSWWEIADLIKNGSNPPPATTGFIGRMASDIIAFIKEKQALASIAEDMCMRPITIEIVVFKGLGLFASQIVV